MTNCDLVTNIELTTTAFGIIFIRPNNQCQFQSRNSKFVPIQDLSKFYLHTISMSYVNPNFNLLGPPQGVGHKHGFLWETQLFRADYIGLDKILYWDKFYMVKHMAENSCLRRLFPPLSLAGLTCWY